MSEDTDEALIVSDTNLNKSFTTRLDLMTTGDRLNNPDPGWMHFIYDHYRYIRAAAVSVAISEAMMLKYRYRVRAYLEEVHGKHDIELAFRIINRIPDDKDFDFGVNKVYIPGIELLLQLYRYYTTYKSRTTKA